MAATDGRLSTTDATAPPRPQRSQRPPIPSSVEHRAPGGLLAQCHTRVQPPEEIVDEK